MESKDMTEARITGMAPDGKFLVEPNTTLTFDRYQPAGTNWIVYKSEYPMSNSVEMD